MKYVSTRDLAPSVDFRGALLGGLAPDGGLYVPESTPSLPNGWRHWSYQQAMAGSLELFGAEDVVGLVNDAANRFDHPEIAPIIEVEDRLVLELFHGPTLSFKDHALQVVARLLGREVDHGTILGATSGDTGSAAIEACRGSKHLGIVILYPEGKVSEFQRRQMTTVPDENVTVVAVRGTFDDCQALVKRAMADRPELLAINSINWARIAAQVGYYVHAGARIAEPFDVVVPTGNFGNAYSCWLAKQIGVPIQAITIANNANHALADLIGTGVMGESRVVATTAPAMDIQAPSNLERFSGDLAGEFQAVWSSDAEIGETIRAVSQVHAYVLDPHTATAWRAGTETLGKRPQLVISTAHPAKFSDVVYGAIGRAPQHPPGFDQMLNLPERMVTIEPSTSDLGPLIR